MVPSNAELTTLFVDWGVECSHAVVVSVPGVTKKAKRARAQAGDKKVPAPKSSSPHLQHDPPLRLRRPATHPLPFSSARSWRTVPDLTANSVMISAPFLRPS